MALALDITGIWLGSDSGRYFIRQVGSDVFWYGEDVAAAGGKKGWTNVACGTLSGTGSVRDCGIPYGSKPRRDAGGCGLPAPDFSGGKAGRFSMRSVLARQWKCRRSGRSGFGQAVVRVEPGVGQQLQQIAHEVGPDGATGVAMSPKSDACRVFDFPRVVIAARKYVTAGRKYVTLGRKYVTAGRKYVTAGRKT